jgi:hypothetical protein
MRESAVTRTKRLRINAQHPARHLANAVTANREWLPSRNTHMRVTSKPREKVVA